jgi:hypothetical protein
MATGQSRRTGRPTKRPTPGARASLGLKVTNEIKQRLDAAAKANGRTQSQEAEARLERTFQNEDLLPQLLRIAYGSQLTVAVLTLAKALKDTGTHAGVRTMGGRFEGADTWFGNPAAYAEARDAAAVVLLGLFPEADPATAGVVAPESAKGLGKEIANGLLEALRNPERGGVIGDWAAPLRAMLDPATVERIPDEFDVVALSLAEPSEAVPSAIAQLGLSPKGKGSRQ